MGIKMIELIIIPDDVLQTIAGEVPGSNTTSDDFLIVEGWGDVSEINRILNESLNPAAWAAWKPYYEVRDEEPYHDLRLGFTGDQKDQRDIPSNSRPPYLVPGKLIGIDDVFLWGFSDEYGVCDGCGNAVRTAPDSYSWQPDFISGDGGLFCEDCISEDSLEEYINNPRKAVPPVFDLHEMGWVELDIQFENGFHSGQNDTPEGVSEKLDGIDHLFTMSPSQFSVSFSVLVKAEDETAAMEALLGYQTPDTGPSDRMKDA